VKICLKKFLAYGPQSQNKFLIDFKLLHGIIMEMISVTGPVSRNRTSSTPSSRWTCWNTGKVITWLAWPPKHCTTYRSSTRGHDSISSEQPFDGLLLTKRTVKLFSKCNRTPKSGNLDGTHYFSFLSCKNCEIICNLIWDSLTVSNIFKISLSISHIQVYYTFPRNWC